MTLREFNERFVLIQSDLGKPKPKKTVKTNTELAMKKVLKEMSGIVQIIRYLMTEV